MLRLDQYTYFIVTAKMIFFGFKLYSEIDRDFEEWGNPITKKTFRIKISPNYLSEDELSAILKQAGIEIDGFLEF